MKVSSPCTGFCKFENEICLVCWRTKEHLLNWAQYTEEERLQIMSNLIANKASYLDEVKSFIQQYEKAQEQIFEEMCKKLNVSKDDKEIFFDYCYNNYEFEHGMEVINSYLKKGDKIGWDKERCDAVMEANQKIRPVGKIL
jgi:predicted Fe-S protein YdhL (DUF1289 family)